MPSIIISLLSFFLNSIAGVAIAAGFFFLELNAFAGYFLAMGLIYILGPLWNSYIKYRFQTETKKVRLLNELEELSTTAELTCAYCNSKNTVKILLNHDNQFTCQNCQETSKVQINLATLRRTEPVYADDVLKNIFVQLEKEKAL